jgi:hypothetical protein
MQRRIRGSSTQRTLPPQNAFSASCRRVQASRLICVTPKSSYAAGDSREKIPTSLAELIGINLGSSQRAAGCSTLGADRTSVRRRGGRKRALGTRAPMTLPQGPKQRWSLDFLSDAIFAVEPSQLLVVYDDAFAP